MNPETPLDSRCLAQFPACMTMDQVAQVVGLAPHNIPVLVQAGLLRPLGHPQPNGVKYFSKTSVAAKCFDEQWLARAVDVVARYWQAKNARRKRRLDSPAEQHG